MHQILSPEEQELFARISFSNLKVFSCSTITPASPLTNRSTKSRNKNVTVRFPTQIFDIITSENNKSDRKNKKIQISQKSGIKFPRLQSRKMQKQKRTFSTICLNQSNLESYAAKVQKKDDTFRHLFANKYKNGAYQFSEAKIAYKKNQRSGLKFNSYMKLFAQKNAEKNKK